MQFHTIQPSGKLADIVRYFWVLEGYGSSDEPLRIPASAFPELIFHYEGRFDEMLPDNKVTPSFITGIHGQSNRFRDFTVHGSFGMIGVHLYPYALKSLFGIPAIDFTNQLPDLISILKPAEQHISESVLTAKSNVGRIQLISQFLEQRIKKVRPDVVYAVKKIIQTSGSVNISALADDCFTSKRQFERNFKDLTGFTAKSFARITRFSALYNTANYREKSLTEIAYDFGYSDQSHFIHEFKEFSGHTPKSWLSKNVIR